jgi:hypothetical protein
LPVNWGYVVAQSRKDGIFFVFVRGMCGGEHCIFDLGATPANAFAAFS